MFKKSKKRFNIYKWSNRHIPCQLSAILGKFTLVVFKSTQSCLQVIILFMFHVHNRDLSSNAIKFLPVKLFAALTNLEIL